MNSDWITWDHPVGRWWIFLTAVSAFNLAAWIWMRGQFRSHEASLRTVNHGPFPLRALPWLSLVYVLVCGIRSVLPKADVQRICLFDTWFSSVLFGRSIATIGELAFAAQWAVLVRFFARSTGAPTAEKVSHLILPLIVTAEIFSWYAVITTNYLGNSIEESLWGVTFTLITVALIDLRRFSRSSARIFLTGAVLAVLAYVSFMAWVDVPMYVTRFQADLAAGKKFFGFLEGIHDLHTRWVVTHSIEDWREEIPWMSFYFSLAVWASIGMCLLPWHRSQLTGVSEPHRTKP